MGALEVENVVYRYGGAGLLSVGAATAAVESVDLSVRDGEIHALVGESGSGKTTLGNLMLRLLRPTEGRVLLDGDDIWSFRGRRVREFRTHVQAVFQDPIGSVSSVRTMGQFMFEAMGLRPEWSRADCVAKSLEMLDLVHLQPEVVTRYSRQLSGGQLQRVVLARALAVEPRFLVLDEPVSALDVVIQAQVVALLREVQAKLGTGVLIISHDLAMCRQLADRVSVMRHGVIVESGPTESLYENPQHEYTKALLVAAGAAPFDEPRLHTSASSGVARQMTADEPSTSSIARTV